METILYIEDDDALRYVTTENLEREGFVVIQCSSGEEALEKIETVLPDLFIIDVMLPKMDGFSVAKIIRAGNKQVPILFLSSRTLKEDRVLGLQLGADDYITKPFSIEEMVLKIRVFLRRSKEFPGCYANWFKLGQSTFDQQNQVVTINNETLYLTEREALVLGILCRNMGQVVRRNDILKEIWGDDDYFNGRSLDVFISRLRKCFRNDQLVTIECIHNVGFRLKSIPPF